MPVDPSTFKSLNVADTCAVWNVLSSKLLYGSALGAGCQFCCTAFVAWECLGKQRKNESAEQLELRERLRQEQAKGRFKAYDLQLEDLGEVSILSNRRKLGRGELSSIAFAIRTRQAFLTDDQGARKLALTVMGEAGVQTTPHLLGWLIFRQRLTDADKDIVIAEHECFGGHLRKYFEEIYERALHYRMLAQARTS